MKNKIHSYDQIVYLLQGGGALGSYQVGVCQALLEHDCAPDWLVGTSIGAINASIIAGNKPDNRIDKLNEFWSKITSPLLLPYVPSDIYFLSEWKKFWSTQWTLWFGQPGFFKPKMMNPWFISSTPDNISFYDTSELRQTLESVIDFELINQKKLRLTLGAVHVKTGVAVRFDNMRQHIGPEHIMASCALPPGFPAIKIGDEYYWDGGISSNTPFSVVLQEKIPKKLLCFIINLFSYREHLPSSMMDVVKSKKELEYASRHLEILHNFIELHYLQHTINSLANLIPNNVDVMHAVKKISDIGHPTALNIVRFHYLDQPSDLSSKDFNFSLQAINDHKEAGYHDALKAFNKPTWLNQSIDASGAIIHEF